MFYRRKILLALIEASGRYHRQTFYIQKGFNSNLYLIRRAVHPLSGTYLYRTFHDAEYSFYRRCKGHLRLDGGGRTRSR